MIMEEEKKEILEEEQESEQAPEEHIPTDAELGVVEAQEGESTEGYKFPWVALIVFGVLVLFFVICVIVVFANGGPIVN